MGQCMVAKCCTSSRSRNAEIDLLQESSSNKGFLETILPYFQPVMVINLSDNREGSFVTMALISEVCECEYRRGMSIAQIPLLNGSRNTSQTRWSIV
jgi:hypothetical protein